MARVRTGGLHTPECLRELTAQTQKVEEGRIEAAESDHRTSIERCPEAFGCAADVPAGTWDRLDPPVFLLAADDRADLQLLDEGPCREY